MSNEASAAVEADPEPEAGFPLAQKIRATGVHFLLSVAAVGCLLFVVMQYWYPGFLFETDGGWQGLRIVVLVDLVLGPALTFVVYRRGKKGLLLDLALIAALQLAALFGGATVLFSERPLAIVLHEGRFYSVTPGDYTETGAPVPDFSALTGARPRLLALRPPADAIAQSEIRTAYMQRKQYIYTHVPWMQPLAEHTDAVLAAAVSREELEARSEGRLDIALADTGYDMKEYVFVPYSSRFALVFIAVRRSDGELVGVLDVNSSPAQ